ncbi:MIS factor, partial [Nothocercus nigrocapillus]|nr:MIS factor [Nothocercus nigrocapillus]
MRPTLRVLLQCLVLFLPSVALPRKGNTGDWLSPVEDLEPPLSTELGLEEEERRENTSVHGRARPGSLARAKVATRLFSKTDAGARCLQVITEDRGTSWAHSSLHPWPLGGLEGPVCRVKMEQDGMTPRHLEVVGVLTRYESRFIKLLRQRASWDEGNLETFGLCPPGDAHAALRPLRHIHAHLAEPRGDRFLVLHLEEGRCCPQPRLKSLCKPWTGSGPGGGRKEQNAELLFQPLSMASHPSSVSFLPEQSLCLSRDTQYLVLGASVASVNRTDEQLSFEVSLAIRHRGDAGAPLPSAETQQLLFGSDDKCFTRMTPVLLLLAKSQREEDSSASSSYLSAAGAVEVAPYPQLSPPQAGTEQLPSPTSPSRVNASASAPGGSSRFLDILTRFIRQVLSPSSEPPTQPSSHHWLDFQVMETLPHQLLNLSEKAALERLVQSEEPSVLLFAQDSSALLEQHLGGWQPEGTVLQLLTAKLQAVIQELQDIPSFQANMGLFQHLLSFCHYAPGPGEGQASEQPPGSGKLHTLLLLKALQTVRARWQERRKVLRQNRSARHQAHCRLQELTIDLHDRKFIVMPTVYAANNCEGPCKLPLSTRVPSYSSHTVLLLGMQERGSPLRRAPCCVPVRYSDQLIISVSSEGLEVRKFPNMVAEECGCR